MPSIQTVTCSWTMPVKHDMKCFPFIHKQCHILGTFLLLEKYYKWINGKKNNAGDNTIGKKSFWTGCILFKFLQRRAQNKILARHRMCIHKCIPSTRASILWCKRESLSRELGIIYFWIMQRLSHELTLKKKLIMMSVRGLWPKYDLSLTNPCENSFVFSFHWLQF